MNRLSLVGFIIIILILLLLVSLNFLFIFLSIFLILLSRRFLLIELKLENDKREMRSKHPPFLRHRLEPSFYFDHLLFLSTTDLYIHIDRLQKNVISCRLETK